MPHPWQHLVVGGVAEPRFLEVSDELCGNQSFESDTSGWLAMPGAAIDRVVDTDTFFGDYAGQVTANIGIGNYVYDYYSDESISGKKFVASLWAKGTTGAFASTTISLGLMRDPSGMYLGSIGERDNPVVVENLPTDDWTFIMVEGECPAGGTQYLKLCVWPFNYTDAGAGQKQVLIDGVMLREIETDYTMPLKAITMVNTFERIHKAEHEMWDYTEEKVLRGHRPVCQMDWSYLDAEYEARRREISEFENIVFYPHNDINWCWLANLSGDLESAYAPEGKFLGHAGGLTVRGKQVLKRKPTAILTAMAEGVGGFGLDIYIG